MSTMEYCLLRSTVGAAGWVALAYFDSPWLGFILFLMMVSWVGESKECKCEAREPQHSSSQEKP